MIPLVVAHEWTELFQEQPLTQNNVKYWAKNVLGPFSLSGNGLSFDWFPITDHTQFFDAAVGYQIYCSNRGHIG